MEAVPYFVWVSNTGRTASVGGSLPFFNDAQRDAEGWSIVDKGWTILHKNGTTGCGRPPFETKDEALEYIEDQRRRWAKYEAEVNAFAVSRFR